MSSTEQATTQPEQPTEKPIEQPATGKRTRPLTREERTELNKKRMEELRKKAILRRQQSGEEPPVRIHRIPRTFAYVPNSQ